VEVELLIFDPAAGSHGDEGLLVEPGPGANAEAVHVASMDEVKPPGHVPVFFSVGDLKFQVGWDEARLDGREVCTKNMGPRVVVSNVHGPDTRAGAYVEDGRWLCDRGQEVPVVES
jgi:hypothetical protein